MEAYRLSARAIVAELGRREGLNPEEVEDRRSSHGDNTITFDRGSSFWSAMGAQFKGFLVWLLLSVALLAFIVGLITGSVEEYIDAALITSIVLINTTLGAYQRYRADRFSDSFGHLETKVRVERSGVIEEISIHDVVVGDIIHLNAGDQVPADARVLFAQRLVLDEGILTGESGSSEKNARTITTQVPLIERSNMVYRGTFVRTGNAVCIATSVGMNTHIGRIAATPNTARSHFLDEVDTAARQITRIVFPLIAVAIIMFAARADSWIDVIMLASALIVGSIPEGLPAVVTFSLSLASSDLAKRGTLVKNKATLETLGSIDVLCTDKTGTLTENRMSVTNIHTFAGDSLDALPKRLFDELRTASLMANEAKRTSTGFIGAPEDTALIDLYNHHDTDIIAVRESLHITRLEPFSSDTKRMHVVLSTGATYEKGAPEPVLADTVRVLGARTSSMTAEKRASIERFIDERSAEGKRLITIIRRDPDPTYLATFALEDPPKAHAARTVSELIGAGIEVKMITGDSLSTAQSIARECGFPHIEGVTWNELKDLSELEFHETVERCSIFARISPADKLAIVRGLQQNGHAVGITGDGVNDVPALKQADIGISMTDASDVAKDAADLIILDGDLSHVLDGIRSGRTVFDNTRKVINYLLTANLSEIVVVFLASLFGLVPFTAIQLLWVNLVTDIGPALAFSADPAHPNVLKRKPNGLRESLIDRRIISHTVFIGLKKVVFLLVIFLFTLSTTGNAVLAQTITFTWLVLSHVARIVSIRIDERLSIFANPWLVASMAVPIALQMLIIYTPLSTYFNIVALDSVWWLLLVGMTGLSIVSAGAIAFIINRLTGGFIADRTRTP